MRIKERWITLAQGMLMVFFPEFAVPFQSERVISIAHCSHGGTYPHFLAALAEGNTGVLAALV